ncbi:MAG: carboxypeptidase regulatory-like domain-containing protein [Acidobacteria bacterium]|nr:carboxypeptidase regulatory-like domain-containing protein [Acidobacteriota bacterium]
MKLAVFAALLPMVSRVALGQQEEEEKHGRKYKPPVVVSRLEVTVLRDNGKPIPNAAVIFRSSKDGEDKGNMELKTGPDGKTTVDVIPTGSSVGLQVIADGFATHGETFSLNEQAKHITVRMQKPKHQVSAYGDDVPGTARGIGVREAHHRTLEAKAHKLAPNEAVVKLPGVSAQGGSSLSGRLIGTDEVPVSDATVTIECADKKLVRMVKTTDDGRYAAVNLPEGTYSIKMAADGFAEANHTNITLGEKQSRVVDQVMENAHKKKAKK